MTDLRPDVTVRPARRSDAPRLAALLAAGSLRDGEDPDDLAAYRSALDEIAVTPGNEVLVAEVDGVGRSGCASS